MSDRPDFNRLLKPAEAAAILGIGTKALRRFDGELKPAFFNARLKRYTQKSLDEFIRRRTGDAGTD